MIQVSEIEDGPEAAILFGGWGSSGCKSLTRSELEEPFLWLLFPTESSPLSVERERSRPVPRWRPRSWNARVFEQIGLNNLVLLSPITHSDTSGMTFQASACVARGWINSSDWLHGGRALVRDGRGNVLSFWKCLCFIFPTITAGGCLGTCMGPELARNTIPSAPGN